MTYQIMVMMRMEGRMPWLNPVNGKLDTKLRVMKGSWDLALMSEHRIVSGLQELVIGSDALTFLPRT